MQAMSGEVCGRVEAVRGVETRSWFRGRAARLVAVVSAVAALTLGPVSLARAETKIVAGMVSHGPPQWPQYVAMEFGWFKENGVSLDLVTVGSSAAQQLASGTIDIAHSGFPDFVRASIQGAPVKIVVNDIKVPPYGVFAKPAIKSIADLKGKTIMIGGVKDVTLIYLKTFLASAKVSSKDVDFVFAKAAGDRFAALASGGVDAAILNPPTYFKASALGFTNLGDIEAHMKDFPFTVWAANTEWAAKNRAVLEGFVRGYTKAVTWLYDPKNKDRAVEILVKATRQNKQDTADAYDYLVTKLKMFSVDGQLHDETWKKMTAGLIDLGDLKEPVPAKSVVFDGSFIAGPAK